MGPFVLFSIAAVIFLGIAWWFRTNHENPDAQRSLGQQDGWTWSSKPFSARRMNAYAIMSTCVAVLFLVGAVASYLR